MRPARTVQLAVALAVACGGAAGTATDLGQACEQVARAGCMRSLTCNLTFTDPDLCADNAVHTCCESDGVCGERLDRDQAARWATCATDLEAQPCDQVQAGPPASCASLPLAR